MCSWDEDYGEPVHAVKRNVLQVRATCTIFQRELNIPLLATSPAPER